MASTGINRRTGKALSDFEHVSQSLEVIFTTVIGTRVMRRGFGYLGLGLLGRKLTPSTFLKFAAAMIMAVDLWEPRLRVTRIAFPKASNNEPSGDETSNTVDGARKGRAFIRIEGVYRPYALHGDTAAETARVITIGAPLRPGPQS